MESVFYGFKNENIMDIKLKYKSWIGEKHADIAHKLIGNDIETFALEFAEHLVKNCSIPNVVGRSEQLKAFAQYLDEMHGGEDFAVNEIDNFLKSL